MKILQIFNEECVPVSEQRNYTVRDAVRAIIFDEKKKIAMIYSALGNFYSLPGGALENGENYDQGIRRECLEEVGCKIDIVKRLGKIIEVRRKKTQINSTIGYLANIFGKKGTPQLDPEEIQEGLELRFVNMQKAYELISDYPKNISLYNKYTQERDLAFQRVVRGYNINNQI